MECGTVKNADVRIEHIVRTYGDMLFKLCLVILKNKADAEDAVQDAFYAYMTKAPSFEDTEHEKAWLIKVATNIGRNKLRYRLRHNHLNIEDMHGLCEKERSAEVLEAVFALPVQYKVAIHLHYFEGYKTSEIANILGVPQTTVLKRLERARQKLKNALEEE